jgi:hypothetical protein
MRALMNVGSIWRIRAVNGRNGYRHRDFDTRAGTLDVAIPKLRSGSYFPDWLLERRRRAEAALTSVVATSAWRDEIKGSYAACGPGIVGLEAVSSRMPAHSAGSWLRPG